MANDYYGDDDDSGIWHMITTMITMVMMMMAMMMMMTVDVPGAAPYVGKATESQREPGHTSYIVIIIIHSVNCHFHQS